MRSPSVLEAGHTTRCTRLALQVAPDADLDALVDHMKTTGLTPQRRADALPGVQDIVTVTDPAGLPVDIFRMRNASARRVRTEGVIPRKLGHTALFRR